MRPGFRHAVLGLALLAAAGLPGRAEATAPIADGARAAAERDGRARVIVRLAAPAPSAGETAAERALRRSAIATAAESALARIGGGARSDLRRYQALPLLALEASRRELWELAEAPEVLSIEADRRNQPSLADSIPRVGANVTTAAGFTGAGSAVAILDTGVESGHAFFGGRVVAEACFSAGHDCPNNQATQFGSGAGAPCTYGSLCYHGTHVAGIAAGSSATLQGVAPAAQIIAIQIGSKLTGAACGTVGSPCVTLYDSDAIAAIDYVVDTLSDSWDVAAVNMSFGGESYASDAACNAANTAFKTAIDAARALGIAAVGAAGNDSITTGIDAPGCISTAIGVGASADTYDGYWVRSNSGAPMDLWAPGTNITSSMPGGGYSAVSGTSMATPHVAGAFAVLHQADPAAGVAALKSALESTGVPLTDGRNGLVRPRLQLDDAVRSRAPAACFDGLDNDSDGAVDVDGNGGTPDADCTDGLDDTENPPVTGGACGVGPELALLLPLLGALRRRTSETRG